MKTTDELKLRPARAAEARSIALLSRVQVEHGLPWRYTPQRVAALIRAPECMVLVAERGGTLAGFAVMDFGDTEGHLYLLAVAPEHRRRGIATRMMAWLTKSARVAGLTRLRLEVRVSNRSARRFYHRLGFRFGGLRCGYYGGRESAASMVKSLI